MTRGPWSSAILRGADRKALLLAAGCTAFLATTSPGQAAPAWQESGIRVADPLVSAEFAKDSVASVTVGVIAGSHLVWTRSVGFADMKTHRPANHSTAYRIGSITKPFTAVMLMQLVAAGKIRLSARRDRDRRYGRRGAAARAASGLVRVRTLFANGRSNCIQHARGAIDAHGHLGVLARHQSVDAPD
jgi:hypothetical protein